MQDMILGNVCTATPNSPTVVSVSVSVRLRWEGGIELSHNPMSPSHIDRDVETVLRKPIRSSFCQHKAYTVNMCEIEVVKEICYARVCVFVYVEDKHKQFMLLKLQSSSLPNLDMKPGMRVEFRLGI